jgi:hypothetical protein
LHENNLPARRQQEEWKAYITVARFGIKTPSDLGNEHMVKKCTICGVKSSGRTGHTRCCSAKKE